MNDQRMPQNQMTVQVQAADPLRLADVTVAAVDQIGSHAAKEIEAAAEAIRKGAEEVAKSLDELSSAIREHSIKASEQVAEFIKRTTHTLETVRGLQAKLLEQAK